MFGPLIPTHGYLCAMLSAVYLSFVRNEASFMSIHECRTSLYLNDQHKVLFRWLLHPYLIPGRFLFSLTKLERVCFSNSTVWYQLIKFYSLLSKNLVLCKVHIFGEGDKMWQNFFFSSVMFIWTFDKSYISKHLRILEGFCFPDM